MTIAKNDPLHFFIFSLLLPKKICIHANIRSLLIFPLSNWHTVYCPRREEEKEKEKKLLYILYIYDQIPLNTV